VTGNEYLLNKTPFENQVISGTLHEIRQLVVKQYVNTVYSKKGGYYMLLRIIFSACITFFTMGCSLFNSTGSEEHVLIEVGLKSFKQIDP
jgi:hypothetical protein